MEDTSKAAAGRPARIRIIALGDELLAGAGDARALGWLGRAIASEQDTSARIELFSSPLPQEGSAALAERWESAVAARTDVEAQETGVIEHRVVLGLGSADIALGTSFARSRLNLAKVLDGLERHRVPAFVVGPPPSADRGRTASIRELSSAFEDVCARRRIPYIDTVTALDGHDQWTADLARSRCDRPGQTGYGLMAWLVLHGGFGTWLGTSS